MHTLRMFDAQMFWIGLEHFICQIEGRWSGDLTCPDRQDFGSYGAVNVVDHDAFKLTRFVSIKTARFHNLFKRGYILA